jgi:hypothetical protein
MLLSILVDQVTDNSSLPEKRNAKCPTVVWSGIQRSLEMALSDILILLDCCYSGIANDSEGNGITELICACPFDTKANGVGHYSFSQALTTELRLLSKKPRFSAGQLFTSIYTRMQSYLEQGIENERYPPPVHFVLTQDELLIRGGIMLSVIDDKLSDQEDIERGPTKRVRFEEPCGSTEAEESESTPPNKRCRLDDTPGSRMEDIVLPWIDASEAYQSQDPPAGSTGLSREGDSGVTTDDARQVKCSKQCCRSYVPKDMLYLLNAPRALFAVRFRGDIRGEDLSVELFREWLRSIPAAAEEVCVEAGFKCFSSLLLITVPLSMWSYMPQHPAIFALGAVKSSIIIPPKCLNKESCRAEAKRCSSPLPEMARGKEMVLSPAYERECLSEEIGYSGDESDVGMDLEHTQIRNELVNKSNLTPSVSEFKISEPATIYVRNILDKFPAANIGLIQRLGECNWQRYVKIRNSKEGSEIDRGILLEAAGSIFQPVSIFHDSGLGSTIPANSCYAASASSFISRAGDADGEYFRVPPVPKEVFDGKPFKCFICRHIIRHIKNRIDWK